MDIKHIHEPNKGLFSVEENNEVLAKLEYSMAGADKMIISHTEVNPVLSGKGVGKQLVAKAVNFAREHKIKILPLCPFAKAIFDKVPEYNDVLF
ncbi:MAG: N-acetyltransferase [Bacteroidetes bacterium]|nr:N-acetyltransferase [Bacteroidota bacterium]